MLRISRATFLSKLLAGSLWGMLCSTPHAAAWTEADTDADFDLSAVSPRGDRRAHIEKLVRAYPEQQLRGLDAGIEWPDGMVMALDNLREKSFEQALTAPELADQLRVPYPKGRSYPEPNQPNGDPGRIRYQPFFVKMYGDNPAVAASRLAKVDWLPAGPGKQVWITQVNGVDHKLQEVADEIVKLPAVLRRSAVRLGGIFNWRRILGTERFSPHSFGVAIDLDPSLGDYWQWSRSRPGGSHYRNRIPIEIVEIFESQGFIWGGKWFHFDTMHFEYRPELLI